jgi:hypothetical protein
LNREKDERARLGVQLLNRIISVTSFGPGGGSIAFRPLAEWFFEDLSEGGRGEVTEEDFVIALSYIREHHHDFYERIKIPRKWDGGAHLEFPHLFIEGETVRVRALRAFPKITYDGGSVGPYDEGDEFELPRDLAIPFIKRRMVERSGAGD